MKSQNDFASVSIVTQYYNVTMFGWEKFYLKALAQIFEALFGLFKQ